VEDVILKYLYPGLKIRSHIYLKFIMANIGQRLEGIAVIIRRKELGEHFIKHRVYPAPVQVILAYQEIFGN
jgi:hypothetical protein